MKSYDIVKITKIRQAHVTYWDLHDFADFELVITFECFILFFCTNLYSQKFSHYLFSIESPNNWEQLNREDILSTIGNANVNIENKNIPVFVALGPYIDDYTFRLNVNIMYNLVKLTHLIPAN